MTICNMSNEAGARTAIIAPDEKTFDYLRDRPESPKGKVRDDTMRFWETLYSDEAAEYGRKIRLNVAALPPLVTWGTSPEQVTSITGHVPRPEEIVDRPKRAAAEGALAYMGLKGGERSLMSRRSRVHRLVRQRADRGSASGGARCRRPDDQPERFSMVVPGSGLVKRQAEAEGARQGLSESRIRLAGAGLLDVPCHGPG